MNNNNNRQPRRPSPSGAPKRQLTAQERAAIEQKRRRIAALKAKKRKQQIDKAKAVFTFAVIGLIISLIIIFGYIFVDFSKTDASSAQPLKITLMGEEAKKLDKENYFHRNGEYYISLTHLAPLLDFTIHGNATSTMTLSDSIGNDIASFGIGTNDVRCGSVQSFLSNPSYFENQQMFIPVSFFTSFFDGVNAEFNSKGGLQGYNLIFEKGFSPKHTTDSGTQSLSYDIIGEQKAVSKPEFISDLSQYEMYMNPENRDEYLILINEDNPLPKDYIPEDLQEISATRKDRDKQKMRLYAAKALEALFIEMRANGFTDVTVTSGYRSYEYQSQLFESRVEALLPTLSEAEARAKVKLGTSLPGTSEHQSGLCIDMHNLPAAGEAFAAEPAYRWLYANCSDFGFIIRYPKNKTDITGVMFEPWHFRYVGRYHARKIMDSGVCLEEYMRDINE